MERVEMIRQSNRAPRALGRNKSYLIIILMIVSAVSGVDRMALGLVIEDIKQEFLLSDTQLGVLTGIAFAFFYSTVGIPIARWADRGNRINIIAITIGLWGIATAMCGAVGSFVHLMLVRIGVAVGDAGCAPTAYSLIADFYDRAERPKAVAIYMLGGPLGAVISYFVAGWLNEHFGWRMMFVLLGLPGIPLALLVFLTLREPRKGERQTMTEVDAHSISGHTDLMQSSATLLETSKELWLNKAFRYVVICFAVSSFFSAGIGQWKPAFFIRSFGLGTGELGTWFAIIYGVGGLLGLYLGGSLATRFASNNERLQLKGVAAALCILTLVSIGTYLSTSLYWAFACVFVVTLGGTMISAPLFSVIQALVPDRMRATAIAVLMLAANLIGMGLGPLAAGVLSDSLRPWLGQEALRYSLLALCPGYLWCAWYAWRASEFAPATIARIEIERSSLDSKV